MKSTSLADVIEALSKTKELDLRDYWVCIDNVGHHWRTEAPAIDRQEADAVLDEWGCVRATYSPSTLEPSTTYTYSYKRFIELITK